MDNGETKISFILIKNKMWNYKIIKSTLGYNITKEREAEIWFLGANRWVLEKRYAKTFYRQQDAINNLPLVRIKDR
jgi:mannose-6-phosphate isomerase class I